MLSSHASQLLRRPETATDILRQALSRTLGLPYHNVVIESMWLDGVKAGSRRLRGFDRAEDVVIKVDYVIDSNIDVIGKLSASEQVLRQQIESEAAARGVPVSIVAISTTTSLLAGIDANTTTTTYASIDNDTTTVTLPLPVTEAVVQESSVLPIVFGVIGGVLGCSCVITMAWRFGCTSKAKEVVFEVTI